MDDYDLSPLSEYEREAWHHVQRWRQSQAQRQRRLPVPVRERLGKAAERASGVWDAAPGTELINQALQESLSGGTDALTDAVAASLRRERILAAVRGAGAAVDDLADLRTLDLQLLDDVRPRLNLRYAAASASTGVGSGFVASGGTAAALGTSGVAAAPSAMAVGAALAADVLATIALAARVVTHYAGYHGYDAREEEEKAFLLAVIGLGVAGEGAAKQAALLHVRKVGMMVARRATWSELGDEAIVRLIQGLFAKLSGQLTKRKLTQALPVAGIAIGAGMNYGLMRRVGTAASYAYKERFLIEKYGLAAEEPPPSLSDVIDVEAA